MGWISDWVERQQEKSRQQHRAPEPQATVRRTSTPVKPTTPNPQPIISKARKGKEGEQRIRSMFADLGVSLYRGEVGEGPILLSDLTLYDQKGRTNQIDHVFLCGSTVLVVEVKNWSGWVFGAEEASRWTVSYSKNNKHSTPNPVRQVRGHGALLAELLDDALMVIPVVAFVGSAKMKTDLGENVMTGDQLSRFVRSLLAEANLTESHCATIGRILSKSANEKDTARHVESLAERHEKPVLPKTDLERRLKDWRKSQAKADGVPSYAILTDALLSEVVAQRPKTNEDLRSIKGIGETRARRWGEQILWLIHQQ